MALALGPLTMMSQERYTYDRYQYPPAPATTAALSPHIPCFTVTLACRMTQARTLECHQPQSRHRRTCTPFESPPNRSSGTAVVTPVLLLPTGQQRLRHVPEADGVLVVPGRPGSPLAVASEQALALTHPFLPRHALPVAGGTAAGATPGCISRKSAPTPSVRGPPDVQTRQKQNTT